MVGSLGGGLGEGDAGGEAEAELVDLFDVVTAAGGEQGHERGER
jgi:hypothetical protein